MKTFWTHVCRFSLAAALILLVLGSGHALAQEQEQEVIVTYDPLPEGWFEIELNSDDYEGRLLKLMREGGIGAMVLFDLSPYDRAEAEIQKTCGGAGKCTSGTTTLDGYPTTWWHNPAGESMNLYFYFYIVDLGIDTDVILITITGCWASILSPGDLIDQTTCISYAENAPEVLPYVHYQVVESETQASRNCSAQISYPTDIRVGEIMAPDVSFWGSNNQMVEPLSYSLFIDGVQTSQVTWRGLTTVVEVNYICPNGKQGRNAITIPGSGSSVIEPIATIEPPVPIDILGPLIVLGGIAIGLAGVGVVGGAILIKTIKNLGKLPIVKKQPVKQPPEKIESEEEVEEEEQEDELLSYDLRLSAERLQVRQGVPIQLAAKGVAYYKLSGEKPAPAMMISISVPSISNGLQVAPLMGSGNLVSTLVMEDEVESNQIVLIVTGQAPGWQDEKRVILEFEQSDRLRFF